MKYVVALSVFFCFCNTSSSVDPKIQSVEVADLVEHWHRNAAAANLDGYIGFMDSACNYIGTDATENWLRDDFADFCKPYFDKKTTWDFTTIEREVRINETRNTAWFDEILDTHMGTCRGSGALELKNGKWKLMQYVLSVAIPNESMNAVKAAKYKADSLYIYHQMIKQ